VSEDAQVIVVLQAARPRLELASDPPGAMILRDGAFVGATPMAFEDLVRGQELSSS